MDLDFIIKVTSCVASIVTCVGVLSAMHFFYRVAIDLHMNMDMLIRANQEMAKLLRSREERDESKKTL